MNMGEGKTHIITIDCAREEGALAPIWRAFGYDEINWTYTPRGKRIYGEIQTLADAPYSIRCHHTFTSGNGLSTPTRGSTNVYQIGPAGRPQFDFTILDQVLTTMVEHGCRPIVELGFMPDPLSSAPARRPRYDYGGSDRWRYPPRDYRAWQDLVFATVKHCVEKFGPEEVADWHWEVWNEPDTPGFFRGGVKDYCKLYDFAVAGATAALPNLRIGGPALAHNPGFLYKFLKHCAQGRNYATRGRGARLDFISVHAKGNGWPHPGKPFEMPALQRILSQLEAYDAVLARFPEFHRRPILVDECDMCVGTNFGVYDFAELEIHNDAYYPVFVVRLTRHLLDFARAREWALERFTTWAFYFEGKRFFEGNRALFTNENIRLPVFNAFVLLEKLGPIRLALESRSHDGSEQAEIDGLASAHPDGGLAVAIWHFREEAAAAPEAKVSLVLRNANLPGDRLQIERFQIDSGHSNAYAVWRQLGAPQDPSEEALARIRQRQGLERVPFTPELHKEGETLRFALTLPCPAVTLLTLRPKP